MTHRPGDQYEARTAAITNKMTPHPQRLWDDQRIKDYLKLELEFANELAAKIIEAHNDWQSHENRFSPVRGLLASQGFVLFEAKPALKDAPHGSMFRELWVSRAGNLRGVPKN
ncbi:hypothetical protein FS837_010482 [Tulasnella sp. UAMH 9824]|nr:hypothetical protein FS837_010482 [Tulasnella sp. UAMH 9824]